MLKSLSLKNFRGFSEHRVDFGRETILIGRNNAGKTTVVEALRVLSVCQARAHTTGFVPCPAWLDQHCQGAGFRPSLETIDFDFANVQHAYDTELPAVLRAKINNNNEIHIFIGKSPDEVFCQLRKGQRHIVHERREIGPTTFGNTKVMPPVGPLLAHEKTIAKDRLNRYLDGYLAHRHFRNQLWERPADYRLFKTILEDTWPGLLIQEFDNDHGKERNEYYLFVREGRFPAEVSWHGHGLQAWMQTIWFLARVSKDATIVLDEPDVYLHADLQRKLIKVIEGFPFRQSIIATHSSEIISDVPFQNVVVVQKRERVSKPATNASEIQTSLRGMGSIHSIQLSKLADRGLVLFVEGDDKPFLTDVAFKMGSRVFDRFSDIAIHELKGKGNWQQALGAAEALKNASGGDIEAALLLDSDYMLPAQRLEFLEKAEQHGLRLKIWLRKEIENYFIIPDVLFRYINANLHDDTVVPIEDIEAVVTSAEKHLIEDLILSYSDVIQQSSPKRLENKTCYKQAKALIEEKLDDNMRIADLASGKDMFSFLSKHFQDSYGICFNALAICKESKLKEMPAELTEFVTSICNKFPRS